MPAHGAAIPGLEAAVLTNEVGQERVRVRSAGALYRFTDVPDALIPAHGPRPHVVAGVRVGGVVTRTHFPQQQQQRDY